MFEAFSFFFQPSLSLSLRAKVPECGLFNYSLLALCITNERLKGTSPLKGTVRIWVFLMPPPWERNTNTQTVTFCAFVCVFFQFACVCVCIYRMGGWVGCAYHIFIFACVYFGALAPQTDCLAVVLHVNQGRGGNALLDWVGVQCGWVGGLDEDCESR